MAAHPPRNNDVNENQKTPPNISAGQEDEEQYLRFTSTRKNIITAVVSVGAFLPPLSSTMVASALPQVADTYQTTGTTINISNALYLVAAGISPCFIGPLSSLYGRRPVLLTVAICYAAFSLGAGLSPNIGTYFAFRILTALAATGFLTTGNTCLGDIYEPTQRGKAGGWFLLAFELGPTCGPFIGGCMVTYLTWRTQFYLQAALGAFVYLLFLLLLPETAPVLGYLSFSDEPLPTKIKKTVESLNPLRVLFLFRYRTILAAGLGSGVLMWNMYSLLTPITYVLNPRFALTSPIQSGVFFLAPGAGYIVGALFGGHWADFVLRAYMRRRNGVYLPEDRLRSCLPFLGIVGPVSVVLYGWSIQKEFGGVVLPVVMMFLQGLAQLFGFLTINPYCMWSAANRHPSPKATITDIIQGLDVMQSQGRIADVIASNYAARYAWGAAGIATALPIIHSVGVSWLSVISAFLMLIATAALWGAAEWGPIWRREETEKAPTRDV